MKDETITEERCVGKGIANALAYFSKRAMLGNDNYAKEGAAFSKNQVIIGRQKDATLDQQLKIHGGDQVQDRVKLQYRDKEGNQLSLK